MSFKNLRSPASNSPQTPREAVAPIPKTDDMRVNGDPVNTSLDGEPEAKWGAPETLPEGRPPMKLNK